MSNQYKKICSDLLRGISERNKIVLIRRFGLAPGKEPETLESIGRGFGITRERVRQIECAVLKKLREVSQKERLSFVQKYHKDWLQHLRMHGGIRREDIFLAEIGGKHKGHATLLLTLNDAFERVRETEDLYGAWACDKTTIHTAREFVTALAQRLRDFGRTVGDRELLTFCRKEVAQIHGRSLPPRIVFSYLDLSKHIGRGPHGLWGLREWPEITPRGLRDRAYLVYKKEGRPLHFTEVAKLIKAHGFARNGRKVLHQSVHNDLIRDPRFVLVGRGMYALQEWGFQPGRVREVILSVLRESARPLSGKEVGELVAEKRQVKPATIFLNLQNKEYFEKTPEGKFIPKSRLA